MPPTVSGDGTVLAVALTGVVEVESIDTAIEVIIMAAIANAILSFTFFLLFITVEAFYGSLFKGFVLKNLQIRLRALNTPKIQLNVNAIIDD